MGPRGETTGEGGEDPVAAMSFTLLEYAIVAGLVVAGVVKVLLRYGCAASPHREDDTGPPGAPRVRTE